jgi:hypothetical protein
MKRMTWHSLGRNHDYGAGNGDVFAVSVRGNTFIYCGYPRIAEAAVETWNAKRKHEDLARMLFRPGVCQGMFMIGCIV